MNIINERVMNIVTVNNIYKTELISAVVSNKLAKYEEIYIQKLNELIMFLRLINNDFILCYVVMYHLLRLQIDLYEKYWILIRMAPLLKFR